MGQEIGFLDARGPRQPEEHWAQVDGHRVHFLKAGAGPELILLHGLVGTAEAWVGTMPILAKASTVYAIDALGIGRSDRVPGLDPRLAAQADRVERFMQEEGLDSADFLATSHGGAVALMLAARHPERVRSLVLHAPANPFSAAADSAVRFYQSRVGRWFAHHILPSLSSSMLTSGSVRSLALFHICGAGNVPESSPERSLKTYIDSLRVPGTIDYLLNLLENWFPDMRALEAALDRVRDVPVLLLWGDRDRVVSLGSSRRLQQCFAQSELVVFPGAAHLAYEECPRLFAEAVNSFLSRERLGIANLLAGQTIPRVAGAIPF